MDTDWTEVLGGRSRMDKMSVRELTAHAKKIARYYDHVRPDEATNFGSRIMAKLLKNLYADLWNYALIQIYKRRKLGY